ncbi:hypothetical protein ACFWPP_06740 [Streptomyces anulatus]|uniref:hypothetical protein n=1 Tax=Streptomyces anulatus TaxID=1892 RepID=UPI0036505EB2
MRDYRFSANVQVIVDADTSLVIATAYPVPGNTAEANAWQDAGLAGNSSVVVARPTEGI